MARPFSTRPDAEDIKIAALAWLLPRFGLDDVVGSEVRFCDGRSIADLVVVTPVKLIGIEIKSSRDTTVKLASQLPAYAAHFHETFLVLDRSDSSRFIRNIPSSVGVAAVEDGRLTLIKRARARKLLAKEHALAWHSRKELEQLLRDERVIAPKNSTLLELRAIASARMKHITLNANAISVVRHRLQQRHHLLVSEMGQTPTLDDLRALTAPTTVKL